MSQSADELLRVLVAAHRRMDYLGYRPVARSCWPAASLYAAVPSHTCSTTRTTLGGSDKERAGSMDSHTHLPGSANGPNEEARHA